MPGLPEQLPVADGCLPFDMYFVFNNILPGSMPGLMDQPDSGVPAAFAWLILVVT